MAGDKAVRYDTVVATLIGVLAIVVAAYTAWIQRQQVRAQVWPVLEYGTSNEPQLSLSLANKGVGPAIVRHVLVIVDDQPVRDWRQALDRLLGPGTYGFSQETITSRVVSPGERLNILQPRERGSNEGLKPGPPG